MKRTALVVFLFGLTVCAFPESREERSEKERCLDLSAAVDDTATSSGVHLKVTAANHCSKDFSGTDTWFEVRAISRKNGGTAGKEVGHFQSTIPPNSKAETYIDVEERYDSKLRFWP
jgi:hypothetical protein